MFIHIDLYSSIYLFMYLYLCIIYLLIFIHIYISIFRCTQLMKMWYQHTYLHLHHVYITIDNVYLLYVHVFMLQLTMTSNRTSCHIQNNLSHTQLTKFFAAKPSSSMKVPRQKRGAASQPVTFGPQLKDQPLKSYTTEL